MSPRAAGRRPTGLESVLRAIARTAARLCEATDALIHLVDGDRHRLAAKHGTLAQFQRVGDTHAIRRDTPLGRAVLERRPVHVHDVRVAVRTRFRGLSQLRLYNSQVRTILVVPLLRDGVALGGIVIRRTRLRPFTPKQIALLKTFADQAAIAIENARLSQSLESRNRELTEALAQQTATAEILRVISESPTDLTPVLQAVGERAARLCDATYAVIYGLEPEGVLRALASHGALPSLRPGEGVAVSRDFPTGRAVLDRCTVRVADLRAEVETEFRGARQLQVAAGTRSVVATPLLREGTPVGALLIRRTELRPFTDSQVTLLETFAAQAVIAIENVRLFNELQARNRALTEALEQQTATSEILRAISSSPTEVQPVLDTIAEHAARLCDALFASVYRFDGELIHLGAHHNYPAPALERSRQFFPAPPTRRFFTGRAILERAVVHVPDAEHDREDAVQDFLRAAGFRSVLSVPMLRDGNPVGAITVWRAAVGSFSDRQVALLQTFADQAVIALENVRLFTELQARNRALSEALEQQTATSEILRVISSSPTDTQPVFDAIIRNAVRLCGALYGAVWRYEGDLVDFVGHHNIPPDQLEGMRRMFPRRADDDPVHQVPRSGSTLEVPDVEQLQAFPETHERWRERGVRSLLVVPMRRDAEIVGAIAVTHRDVGAFSQGRVELLKTFADQAVIAVENARLFSELQQRTGELGRSVEQLRALSDVGQAVSSTLDLDAVLQAIVTRAAQLAGTRGCSIWEYDERAEAFHLRATTILDAEVEEILRSAGIRKGEGAIGRAALTKGPVQIPDVSVAGAYEGPLRDALLRAGGGSVLTLPLLHEDRLLGGLTVSRRVTGEFPPDTVALLSAFAAQSAIALQNARLFRELEAKSHELEVASQHKSQFLANMSHELRTPLNAILGYGELIADGIYGDVPPAMRDVLVRVDASGRHLLGLINDVLDLSKIEAGQLVLALADYAMTEVVESVLASVGALASDKGLTLAVDLAPDLPTGRGDQRRLMQVLLNLVGNAIKFTEEGGIGVQVAAPGAAFEISVRDTGPGIAPADQARIFEEFQQADTSTTRPQGGTGLGLAISRRIVGMHGGRLWVESVVGEGATFRFTVPVRVDQQVTPGTSETA